MQTPDRDDIHIISRHSNWAETEVEQRLQTAVYPGIDGWKKFLQIFLPGAGVAFTVSGIIFFFAYNWDNLGKFAKMGTVGGVLLAMVLVVLLTKVNGLIKNILLAGAAVLVGGLFAVYGQVYQTGADAYQLFVAWSVFVTLWVIVSDFAPLWFMYLVLLNTTAVLYLDQEHRSMHFLSVCIILFVFNTACLVAALVVNAINGRLSAPNWFTNLLATAVVCIATTGIVNGIIDGGSMLFPLVVLTAIGYSAGAWYGFSRRRVMYFALLAFSVIVIVASAMIKASHDTGMFLIVSLFIVAAITVTVQQIIQLQKRWADV